MASLNLLMIGEDKKILGIEIYWFGFGIYLYKKEDKTEE